MQTKTKIINLFGGPGTGKSTTATGVFSALKQKGFSVEYVSEYAKDLTWDDIPALLSNQVHVFAEQFRRQWRLIDKVEWVITDSPLLLSSIYYEHYFESSKNSLFSKNYYDKSVDFFDSTFMEFNNVNFIINRKKDYVPVGRVQTEDQAKEIDALIQNKFDELLIPYYNTNSQESIRDVLNYITAH